ncbi:MAG: flagellar motor protein MotB, partial [Pseudomonadota bacterium]|nr:flagellar motor protein MotB [Pseudomonadota bacterium]
MAKKPIPIPVVPVEQPKQEEPPKCPPVGAPAWMATFADIAILLMAFFVLILSFAEFNQPKFKMIAGSLRESFGVQRDIPVVEQPRGTTVLELKFSPSPEPSITKELTQDTTTTEQPKIRSDVEDQQKRSDHDQKQTGDQGEKSEEERRDEMRQELA